MVFFAAAVTLSTWLFAMWSWEGLRAEGLERKAELDAPTRRVRQRWYAVLVSDGTGSSVDPKQEKQEQPSTHAPPPSNSNAMSVSLLTARSAGRLI